MSDTHVSSDADIPPESRDQAVESGEREERKDGTNPSLLCFLHSIYLYSIDYSSVHVYNREYSPPLLVVVSSSLISHSWN